MADGNSSINVNIFGEIVDEKGQQFTNMLDSEQLAALAGLPDDFQANVIPQQNTFASLMALVVTDAQSGQLCKPTDVDGCIIQLNSAGRGGNTPFYSPGVVVEVEDADFVGNAYAVQAGQAAIVVTGTGSASHSINVGGGARPAQVGQVVTVNNQTSSDLDVEDAAGTLTLVGGTFQVFSVAAFDANGTTILVAQSPAVAT